MNVQQVREKARSYGIKLGKSRKVDLIKSIQMSEGNFACFGSAVNNYCDQTSCLWREDCLGSKNRKT